MIFNIEMLDNTSFIIALCHVNCDYYVISQGSAHTFVISATKDLSSPVTSRNIVVHTPWTSHISVPSVLRLSPALTTVVGTSILFTSSSNALPAVLCLLLRRILSVTKNSIPLCFQTKQMASKCPQTCRILHRKVTCRKTVPRKSMKFMKRT